MGLDKRRDNNNKSSNNGQEQSKKPLPAAFENVALPLVLSDSLYFVRPWSSCLAVGETVILLTPLSPYLLKPTEGESLLKGDGVQSDKSLAAGYSCRSSRQTNVPGLQLISPVHGRGAVLAANGGGTHTR